MLLLVHSFTYLFIRVCIHYNNTQFVPRFQGHPSCEISSTNTGSDESSSTPQDGDIESDGGPDTDDDELGSPITEAAQAFITPERKSSSEKLYTWKEVSGLPPDSPTPVRIRSYSLRNL